MLRLTGIISAVILGLVAFSAQAREGWYIAGEVGGTFVQDSDIDDPTGILAAVGTEVSFDAGYFVGATVGYAWTNDVGRAHRLASALDAGMIWVNSENNRHLPSPFGGMKASGIGRDGGDYSFEFYMETKNVCIALGTHNVPSLGKR